MTAAEWGRQLAAVRRARGWTQESLAERVGVSRQAVAKWERGAALPGPGNLLALRQCLGDALPEPPGPAGEGAAESAAVEMPPAAGDAAKAEAPAADASPDPAGAEGTGKAAEPPVPEKPAAPKGTGKGRKSRPWLVALAVLCVVFCLISLVTYVFTAVAGAYLLLVTVAAVAAWAVVCKVRGQSAAPALWGGLKAVGVQVTALAVAAVFAYFVWLAGAGYRVDALVPLTETVVRQYPALAERIDDSTLMQETPCALCIGGPVPGERITKRYLVAARGVTGEPATHIRTRDFRIRLTWQPGAPDEMQYYLVQCSGDWDFNIEVTVTGPPEQQIDLTALPDSQQTQAQWDTDLQELWQTFG